MTPARKRTTRTAAVAATAVLGLALTGCASDSGSGGSGDGASSTGEDETSVSIGIPSGWDEGIAVSHLWTTILEDEGYDVSTQTADVGVVYTGLVGGDFDLTLDVWLPYTHASYEKKYGGEITDLGYWYDDAKLTIAVNEDSPRSPRGPRGHVRRVRQQARGHRGGRRPDRDHPGPGHPHLRPRGHGLLHLLHPAMLAELKGATDSGENIAVTLWRPHWAYDEFPVRDLEDPEGALGEAEKIHMWGSSDFEERYPTLTKMLGAFSLDDEQLFSLENMMFNSDEYADEQAAVEAWLEENPTFVDDLKEAAGV